MRALSIAAVIVLSSLAGLTYAQGAAQGKETEITQPTPIVLERPLATTAAISSPQGNSTLTPSRLERQLKAVENLSPQHPDRISLQRRVAEERCLRQGLRCVAPDGSAYAVNAVIEYYVDERFRCVEIYDEQLNPARAGWAVER